MALPLTYNLRNIVIRWRATVATITGVALVVAVYVLLQALGEGLEKNSANTGDDRNVMIARKGSNAESGSQIPIGNYRTLQYMEGIARDDQGKPLMSADLIVLANLPRKAQAGEANVQIRGTSPIGFKLRPQVKLVSGRWFTPGKREIVVSQRMANRFANFGLGEQFKVGPNVLTVVGWMDGGKSAFDSELWMDADEARQIFDREAYSSLLFRPESQAAGEKLIRRIENDRRMILRGVPETDYYKAQTMAARPIKYLGNFLATAMSIGAVCAAMNTMYASIGSRVREIGTLRVLGYHRRTILLSFLLEGAILALIGGVIGCLLALPMQGYATSTIGFESFSEVVFEFRITPALLIRGLIFSVLVGLVGSLLPSMRAARLPVIAALKSL